MSLFHFKFIKIKNSELSSSVTLAMFKCLVVTCDLWLETYWTMQLWNSSIVTEYSIGK